jgi:phytoene dehydrogenase-like protein
LGGDPDQEDGVDERIAAVSARLAELRAELDDLVVERLLDVVDPERERRRQRALAQAQRALERAQRALREASEDEEGDLRG